MNQNDSLLDSDEMEQEQTQIKFKPKGPSEYVLQDKYEQMYKSLDGRTESGESKPRLGLILFTAAFCIFVVSDFFFHKTYFSSSCKLTVAIQKAAFLEPISTFFSTVMAYWTVAYLLFVLPISPFGYVKTTHYLVIFFAQLWCLSWMKPAYGRSRPVLQCPDVKVWSCACDYGMPSGHSSIGAMNGYIMGDFILTHLKMIYSQKTEGTLSPQQVESKFRWVRILSWVLGACVALSRIAYGVHSWNQVVTGFCLSLIILHWLNEETWKKCVLRIGLSTRSGKNTILYFGIATFALSYGIFQVVYSVAIKRPDIPDHDPPLWDRCPNCEKTFKTNSLTGMGGVFMISAFFISLYFNSLTKERSQGLNDECGPGKFCKRIVISTLLMFVFIILVFFFSFIAIAILGGQSVVDKGGIYIISIMAAVILYSFVVWIIYWRPLILTCCGLAIKKDFIQPNIGFKKNTVQQFERFNTNGEDDDEGDDEED